VTHIFLPADILDISLLAIVSLNSDAGIYQNKHKCQRFVSSLEAS